MFKHLTHLIGAAAIALAATSAPAVAQDRNNEAVGNAIIGLTFLALVGAAMVNGSDDRDDDRREQPRNLPQDRGWHERRLAPLPDECLSARLINREARLVYGQSCLNRNYRDVAQLRPQCRVEFDTPRGVGRGYDANCLESDRRIRQR